MRRTPAYEVTRFVAETVRERVTRPAESRIDPARIQRQLAHIAERTGHSQQDLNSYLVAVVFPDEDYHQVEVLERSAEIPGSAGGQRDLWTMSESADVEQDLDAGPELL